MFAGHYGVGFAVKSVDKRIPLWQLFLAVQFLDVVWGPLVLLGIEKVRIVPGITASLPLDFYYNPYTHSLVGAMVLSGLAGLGYRTASGGRASQALRSALLVGLAVLSHWILDLLVHRPDLPLYDNTHKMGLGLWNYPVLAFGLEATFLFGGMWLYLRSTAGTSFGGRFGMPLFGLGLLVVQAVAFFGPPPRSPAAAAITFLTLYALMAGIAFWLEKKRT
jgi:hypothetical protein